MKVAFATLGCRVNVYESEAMAEKFIREGYEVVDFNEFSDVYVINTCTVTNMGDKKSRQIISRARRTNPDAIIAAVGCYSQMAPKEVSEIPGVDVVLGTRNKGDVVYYVNKAKVIHTCRACAKLFISVPARYDLTLIHLLIYAKLSSRINLLLLPCCGE